MKTNYIVAYTSLSGNTKAIANLIAEAIQNMGHQVDIREMYEMDATELNEYDHILLGSCTWGDGELPHEALVFYEEMDHINLQGKTAAAFGSCDSNYYEYGAAVDLLAKKTKELGADIVLENLKIEGYPTEEGKSNCMNFGMQFVENSEQKGILQ